MQKLNERHSQTEAYFPHILINFKGISFWAPFLRMFLKIWKMSLLLVGLQYLVVPFVGMKFM